MKISSASTVLALLGLSVSAHAQNPRTLFSVDWHGPTVGMPDTGSGTPITAGDILTPAAGMPMLGPLATPSIAISHGFGGLGLMPGCIGVPGGTPCHVEVDALSAGLEPLISPNGIPAGHLHFSVDRFAKGFGPVAPNVFTEFPVGDAPADVMLNVHPLIGGPLPPGPTVGHRGLLDGNGLASGTGFAYPGLGLIEPSMPIASIINPGDNIDALDTIPVGPVPVARFFFSLDSWGFDPLTGAPNSGSATAHGFSGADVLVTGLGLGAPMVYAPSFALGLISRWSASPMTWTP
ncbi:MAG: hypothetical protein R3E96_13055 [Planctomycetota bacterium]